MGNPEWYITAENRYLFYENDDDDYANESNEAVQDLQLEITHLGTSINDLHTILYNTYNTKPYNDIYFLEDNSQLPHTTGINEPFYDDFMYYYQLQTENLLRENALLNDKFK